MDDCKPFGKHWLRVEPNGVIFLKYQGEISRRDFEELAERLSPCLAAHDKLWFVCDMAAAGLPDAEARKYAGDWIAQHSAGSAMFGATLTMRTVGELLRSLSRRLHQVHVPFAYFVTEAEARAWVDEQRRQPAGS